MSLLSPRLQLKVAQKQILTPGLVQMVTVLQLNRLELKDMITQEIVKNPVLEESTEEAGEEVTPEELLPLLEPERVADPADQQILEAAVLNETNPVDGAALEVAINGSVFADAEETAAAVAQPETVAPDPLAEPPAATDPFDEIDFGSFFDDYLDPGYKSPASESVEKPSFETFRWATICARSSVSAWSPTKSVTPPNPSSAIWMKTGTSQPRWRRSRPPANIPWRMSSKP
jgi:RNA polymerase sigma-54 factor